MSSELAPRLSHVGLYVHDVPKMIDFYTKTLGFVVSDGAEDGRITFLSRNPSDHHQVVLVRGRTTDPATAMVQQVSFNVGTLASAPLFGHLLDLGMARGVFWLVAAISLASIVTVLGSRGAGREDPRVARPTGG